MLLDRSRLQRELEDLDLEREAVVLPKCAEWTRDTAVAGAADANLTHPDAAKVSIPARCYAGTTKEVAVVVGGWFGDDAEEDALTTALRTALDDAYNAKKRAARMTILIPLLYEKKRWSKREVAIGKKTAQPFSNFPIPGEGYEDTQTRKKAGDPELVDPDPRRFPKMPPQMRNSKINVSGALLPENRVLITFLNCIKPARLVLLHASPKAQPLSAGKKSGAWPRGKPRDGAGILLYPQGGLDPSLEAVLGAPARAADAVADAALKAADAALSKTLPQALEGNRPLKKGYDTVHALDGDDFRGGGTTLGMWAPTAIRAGGSEDRPPIVTLRIGVPKIGVVKKSEVATVADAWAKVIVDQLLEVQ